MPIKPRGQVNRSTSRSVPPPFIEPEITIAAWCPDDRANDPPEQVHFLFEFPQLGLPSLLLRYKSPDTLGFLIEELARYRAVVWPDAEPVNVRPE